MKCPNCHCHILNIKPFQKKRCPTCGLFVTGIQTPHNTKTPSDPDVHKVEAAQDKVICVQLLLSLSLLLSIIITTMTRMYADLSFLSTLLFVLGCNMVVCMALFVILLIRVCIMRQRLPVSDRPAFLVQLLKACLCGTFLIMGIASLCGGWEKRAVYNNSSTVQAQISRIDVVKKDVGKPSYHVYIVYTYDGQLYENVKYPTYSSSMRTGDPVTIQIDPENPEELSENPVIVIVAGALLTPVSCISLWFVSVSPLLKRKRLRTG